MLDVFVLPSVSEALSNALIEAMACGVCAVASRVGGNPELIGADERGWLFDAGNAHQLGALLVRLANDCALRHGKAATARSWIAANMAIGAATKKMAQIYEKHLRA
jgi:glycosyltransferase involved in cell wall biosynthesis